MAKSNPKIAHNVKHFGPKLGVFLILRSRFVPYKGRVMLLYRYFDPDLYHWRDQDYPKSGHKWATLGRGLVSFWQWWNVVV